MQSFDYIGNPSLDSCRPGLMASDEHVPLLSIRHEKPSADFVEIAGTCGTTPIFDLWIRDIIPAILGKLPE